MRHVPAIVLLLISAVTLWTTACNTKRSTNSFTGHYTWGHEVNTFTPCSSSQTYWVTGSDAILELLRQRHQDLTTAPYESVHVRLSGEKGEVPVEYRDGFPGDYDGMFTVSLVHEIREADDSDCAPAE